MSPSSPRGDGEPAAAAPCDGPPPTDDDPESHDRGDERQSAASPWTQAEGDDVDTGDQVSDEADRMDVVELDTVSDYSATDEHVSECGTTVCGVSVRTVSARKHCKCFSKKHIPPYGPC